MNTTFDSVMIGSVIECVSGRRLIKVGNKNSQPNAQDETGADFHLRPETPVRVLTSPIKMGRAYIKAYTAREAAGWAAQEGGAP